MGPMICEDSRQQHSRHATQQHQQYRSSTYFVQHSDSTVPAQQRQYISKTASHDSTAPCWHAAIDLWQRHFKPQPLTQPHQPLGISFDLANAVKHDSTIVSVPHNHTNWQVVNSPCHPGCPSCVLGCQCFPCAPPAAPACHSTVSHSTARHSSVVSCQ
jgi:hypothetical protein